MAKTIEVDDDGYPMDVPLPAKPRGKPGPKPKNKLSTVPDAAHAGPPLRRTNPRPPQRTQPTHELAREPSRASSSVTGRNGEELKRTLATTGGDIFERVKSPPGWDYQWNAVTAINKELAEIQAGANVDMHANGWRPVPSSRHPGIYTSMGHIGEIIVKGQRLEERPAQLGAEARREDELRAKAQVRDQTDGLRLTQSQLPGASARNARAASGMKMSIDKSFDLPPDQNYDIAE